MRYLLDTHAFLWHFEGSDRLSGNARTITRDTNIPKYVSVASLWEFVIKYSMGKLQFEGGFSRLLELIAKSGFIVLPLSESYLTELLELPFIHRDPFDRMLVATAKADGMTILTTDENICKYDVPSLW